MMYHGTKIATVSARGYEFSAKDCKREKPAVHAVPWNKNDASRLSMENQQISPLLRQLRCGTRKCA